MATCIFCGKVHHDTDKFCRGCGIKITPETTLKEKKAPAMPTSTVKGTKERPGIFEGISEFLGKIFKKKEKAKVVPLKKPRGYKIDGRRPRH